MKVVVLGASGMLGHRVHETLSLDAEVVSVTRRPLLELPVDPRPFFIRGRVIEGVDATDLPDIRSILEGQLPDAVINCVGIVKQREESRDPLPSIEVNALLPHQLGAICADLGARLIHFSTDCVFSGQAGGYREEDASDALDLYGRTKFLGEVQRGNALTIRTSIIGRELDHFQSLIEWFIRQQGVVRGYTKAVFTGVTTHELARVVSAVLWEHPGLSGLYQLASRPIDKFDLLARLRREMHLEEQIDLVPDDSFVCDRSLDGRRFMADTGTSIPSWNDMLTELVSDSPRYGRVSS